MMAYTCLTPAGWAEERINPIRKAAMERLRDKLGTIRGAIDPSDRAVLLTTRMIELRKPFELERPNSSIETLRTTKRIGFDTITTAAVEETGSAEMNDILATADRIAAGQ